MAQDHTSFQQALSEAQSLGFAESDPTNDVEGIDAGYKLAILASLAYHRHFQPEDVFKQGISSLEAKDFRYARELGYAIKPLAIANLSDDAVQTRVHPALVPLDHMLAKVDGVYNAVEVEGSLCGNVIFHGMGAGREPTASAVVGDMIELAKSVVSGQWSVSSNRPPAISHQPPATIDQLSCRYYLRLTLADRPGVLAQIARILGDGHISIASVLQKDTNPDNQTADIVITTHPAVEASVQNSLKQVVELEVVHAVNNLLRIEA